MSEAEGRHGPRLVGRTHLSSPGVSSDPKRVQADFEAGVAVENERRAALSGPLVVRCAKCPDWIGHSVAAQIEHMHVVHGVEPVSKEGKYDKRCPVCRRTFYTDVTSMKFCSDRCRATMKPTRASKPMPMCEHCGKPCPDRRNRFCSRTCSGRSHAAKNEARRIAAAQS